MYQQHFSTRKTSQRDAIPGKDMAQNNAGGYGFAVDDWVRLDRFLILGAEGGTYYVKAKELTKRNAEAVLRCLKADGPRTVNRIAEISEAGRAPKNDPALFALAMAASLGSKATREMALDSLPRVARIGTHLFHFARYIEAFRGWGRGLRRAVGNWYTAKPVEGAAYQMVKYQSRDGWSHRDLLRLAHPKSETHSALFGWATQGKMEGVPVLVAAFEEAKTADKKKIVELIHEYGLTREMVPTEALTKPEVWEALLAKMPMTAMIRNLGNMSKVGLLIQGAWDAISHATGRITNQDNLRKARVHPLSILAALNTYGQGHGMRGTGTWEPVPDIVDALDAAFYLAFENVEPTGKRFVLGIDVSGSMSWENIAGVGGITPAVGAAAMAMTTFRVEQMVAVMAFAGEFRPIAFGRNSRLSEVIDATRDMNFGRTDCALPMLWATKNKIEADAFVVYTDNETWCGQIHPIQALDAYRRTTGIPAKLIVVGMTSGGFSIADPDDAGMLDVVGFDTATPNVISDFASDNT